MAAAGRVIAFSRPVEECRGAGHASDECPRKGVRMGSIGRAIREELRRFERRRLRPLARWFRPRPADRRPACDPVRVDSEPRIPAAEELLIALVRAELRRRSSAVADASPPALADLPGAPGGATEAERLVRALLEPPPFPRTDHEACGEAA